MREATIQPLPYSRSAGDRIPAPTYEAGDPRQQPLEGRFAVDVLNCSSRVGRWWRIILAPSTFAFDGRESMTAASSPLRRQETGAVAKISFGADGNVPAMYVNWPARGGDVCVFGSSIRVEALVKSASIKLAEPGPYLCAWADYDPPDIGAQDAPRSMMWDATERALTLGVPQDLYLPPYARRLRVYFSGSPAATLIVLQQLSLADDVGTFIADSRQVGTAGTMTVDLHPRAAKLQLLATGPMTIYPIVEVQP